MHMLSVKLGVLGIPLVKEQIDWKWSCRNPKETPGADPGYCVINVDRLLGKLCQDQIITYNNQVIEKCLSSASLTNFIDFEASFDSVHSSLLCQIPSIYSIPQKIINIIWNSHHNTICAVKYEASLSSCFKVITGAI